MFPHYGNFQSCSMILVVMVTIHCTYLQTRREGGHCGQDGERQELPDAGVVPHGGLRRGQGGNRRREHEVHRSCGASVETHDHPASVYLVSISFYTSTVITFSLN